MGCGLYFTKGDVLFIEGIAFCEDCKAAAAEFKTTVQSERKAIRQSQGFVEREEDKWEGAWSSEQMISLSRERLEKFPHPIPIDGLEPKLISRIVARLLDVFFVVVWFVAVDSIFYLSKLTSWMFGSENIPTAALDYPSLLDPKGIQFMFDNGLLLQRTCIVLILLIAAYRIPVMLIAGRTMGELFAGVMLTNGAGKYPTIGSRFLRGFAATLGDASLIGPFVDMFFYSITRPSQSISDAVSGVFSVRYEAWKTTARGLIHRRSVQHTSL
jgi:hypothetical protein